MHHVLYGLIAGFTHRHRLASILRETPPKLSIHAIDPAALKQGGISVLALDFDGVLAPHGYPEPLPEATAWLTRCESVFGEERLFILSNKPSLKRSDWFRSRFPGIRFISGVKKKPYPDGLLTVIKLASVRPDEVMLIDDRLLTGVLATCLAGTRITYINSPYVTFSASPIPELFFCGVRTLERILLGLIPPASAKK